MLLVAVVEVVAQEDEEGDVGYNDVGFAQVAHGDYYYADEEDGGDGAWP